MVWRLDLTKLPDGVFRRDPDTGRLSIVVPPFCNIAQDTVGRHASGSRAGKVALIFEDAAGKSSALTFAELDQAATRLASRLQELGIRARDRVAVHSVQRPETVIAHLAIYKIAAIATTVSALMGPDTVLHVLEDSGARAIVTHDAIWQPLRSMRSSLGRLEHVIVSGDASAGELSFGECIRRGGADLVPARTSRTDPALLIYTSGSTGQPKGILHAHGILPALNATIELFYNLELREQNLVFWTASDWAWIGGLNDVVFPALAYGHTLIASEHRFDAEWALQFMARHGVTHTMLTPTALKRIVQVSRARPRPPDLCLRTIFTGGEALPGDTHRALSQHLGAVCNEGYGLSEVNQMIGNCQRLRHIEPGSMGWDFPGHEVTLVDENGKPVRDGEIGEICVSPDDPTLFLGYWEQPTLTGQMRLGEGLVRTHDLAVRDEDGYYWYRGRSDDLIKSAGFRIGPSEVEDALQQHGAVADAGVIGIPDQNRGQIVKAFVRLVSGIDGSDELADELRQHVKARIGPYKQPRVIEFVAELPATRTGKVSRAQLRRREAERTRGD